LKQEKRPFKMTKLNVDYSSKLTQIC